MKIGTKTFVSLSYSLDVNGQIVDSAGPDSPLQFVYGAGYLLPKFEENIKDLQQGDTFEFTLTPENGYGEIIPDAITDLPKSVFMVDGSVEDGLLTVGNQIPMSTADGQHIIGMVVDVADDTVKMDFNHPMAGKTLNFKGRIEGVREATSEDMMPYAGRDCSSCTDSECGGSCSCGS